MEPLVSIIILTYSNGWDLIEKCLRSIERIDYKNFEIIVVDNGSTDDTLRKISRLRQGFGGQANFKLIRNRKNLGFCVGNNQAVMIAKGKYILFLNNDTQVSPNFLTILVSTLERDKSIGVAQPKIRQLRDKNKLDAVASYITSTGFLYHYGYSQNEKDKKYNKKLWMYSAKGACFLTRKSLIDKIGLFDDDYFAYFEETDFCHRVWLAGYKVAHIPSSEIFHLGGVDKKADPFIEFHSFKNRIQTYLKNLGTTNLFKIVPVHLAICAAIAMVYLLRFQFRSSFAVASAIAWNFLHFNLIYKKRAKVQKIRKVNDSKFFPIIEKPVEVSYYKHFFLNPRGYYDFKEI